MTPEELSELVTQLAFYAGWPVAVPALDRIAVVLADRGITPEVALDPELLPYDEDARLASVDATARPVSPGLPTRRTKFCSPICGAGRILPHATGRW